MRFLLALILVLGLTAFGRAQTNCGETSSGSVDNGNAGYSFGTPCATGANAAGYTASTIYFWVDSATTTSFDFGIYSDSSGAPASLLCSASTGTITPSSGWNSIAISGCGTLSANAMIWIGFLTQSNTIGWGYVVGLCGDGSYSVYDNGGGSDALLPNPFGASTPTTYTGCYSIYAVLNAVTGAVPAFDKRKKLARLGVR